MFFPQWLIEKDVLTSTQDEAKLWLQSSTGEVSFWCRAQAQLKGRGRQGRAWLNSEPGASLLCSFAFRAPTYLKVPCLPMLRNFLTLAAGAALIETLQAAVGAPSANGNLFLKWPNDLYWKTQSGGLKKIGGILTENFNSSAFVVGWGLNVGKSPETLESAASLIDVFPQTSLSVSFLFEALRMRFLQRLCALVENGAEESSILIADLEQRAMAPMWGLSGFSNQGSKVSAVGLAPDGGLKVKDSMGALHVLYSGEFQLTE